MLGNNSRSVRVQRFLFTVSLALLSMPQLGAADPYYSPPANRSHPTEVYWGDTHLHTNMSVDANGMGNRALSPEIAYRFAKGETVRAHNGELVRLRRPLDFIVVCDHAVNLGVLPRIQKLDPLILRSPIGQRWLEALKQSPLPTGVILTSETPELREAALAQIKVRGGQPGSFFWAAWTKDYVDDPEFRRSVWQEVCANADRHNDPGKFTAFIGYEWTPPSSHPRSPNFHRNVIFEGGAEQAGQILPFSNQDSVNVEDLWAFLQDYEDRVGGKVLAIPHNGNLSGGMMFRPVDYDNKPITTDYAQRRSHWEPLYEMTQYKGDSEAHPALSPTDEFADYETWHRHGFFGRLPEADEFKEQKRYEYARSALKVGLDQQHRLGVNPFKFGMIGSTDAHTSLTTADENNFWGKISLNEPSPHRIKNSWHFACSGMAAVWATENTRSAIFAALRRKETYATTGPRMSVRFFGGWDYVAADAYRHDLDQIGYRQGVPMGGDLSQGPPGKSPTFLIRAVKDPDGANLDRVQVVKGWRDRDGKLHEQIHDVALADGREADTNGKIPSVGSTVDIQNATYSNSIGDPELAVVWSDPDFDPSELAFYYVRVIEIPTPRWTAYDAKHYGITDLPENVPMVTQERAYTSPIWFTP